MEKFISIKGARAHNLKDVDVNIPINKLTCLIGPSGSGKTSLAFHTLLAESRRRLINSFPSSLKFFSDRPSAVDVDEIKPVLPTFGLPQINPVLGARSTVSDVVRLTDEFQRLFYYFSESKCPHHHVALVTSNLKNQIKNKLNVEDFGTVYLLLKKEDAINFFQVGMSPTRSLDSNSKLMHLFNPEDEFWEILRLSHKTSIDPELEKKIQGLPLYIFQESQKKPLGFHFSSNIVCPHGDYEKSLASKYLGDYSPYNAQGACSHCQGHGANLIYSENKMFDFNKSLNERGLPFLEYKTFSHDFDQLKKIMRKKGWSFDLPLKKLSSEFKKILMNGEKNFCGVEELTKYLDKRKYKISVRVFIRHYQEEVVCEKCHGSRYNNKIREQFLDLNDSWISLPDLVSKTISEIRFIFEKTKMPSDAFQKYLYENIFNIVTFAEKMGLGHLRILRKTKTLSAGEYQRLLLIKYLSYKGTEALFILDEPSLGLGQAEKEVLVSGLRSLIALGNTVVLIDHSDFIQSQADYWIQMGPGSGAKGGYVEYQGKPLKQKIQKFQIERIQINKINKNEIKVIGPSAYDKSFSDFILPLNELVWVHGDSGSGKTCCLVNVLANDFYKKIYHENLIDRPGTSTQIKSSSNFEDVIICNSNLNRFTSRSTVGTMTELSPIIRRHFMKLPISKRMSLKEGHFSSNSELGMCSKCEGSGKIVIEMQYLEDIELQCEDCDGNGIKKIFAQISDGQMSVAESYSMPLSEVLSKIELTPKFRRIRDYLTILHLDYLSLERPLNSLSGGEKQRIYLLSKLLSSPKNTLIIFENISFGLSIKEIKGLGQLIAHLVQDGNSVVVIDSDPIFSKMASSEMVFTASNISTKSLTDK